MCLLYSNEKKIIRIANKIIRDYNTTDREKKKKLFELFHLLVFLDISKLNFKKIIPNEPGDFIIETKNERYIIEITSVFGNAEENIKINNILDKLFGLKNELKIDNNIFFNNEKMKNLFLKKLKEKDGKNYFSKGKISNVFLLIVTAEYNNCPSTGEWFCKFLQNNELFYEKNFNKVLVLDYFASGKDGDPIAIEDFYNNFLEYKNILNKN